MSGVSPVSELVRVEKGVEEFKAEDLYMSAPAFADAPVGVGQYLFRLTERDAEAALKN